MTKSEGPSARYCFSFIKFAQNFKKIEPMRKILLLLLCVPMLVCAKSKRDDSKYLVGAVPEVNGQVLFQQTFAVEGKKVPKWIWRMPLPVRFADFSKNG